MRLGKFVEHFKAAGVAADITTADPLIRRLAVGRQLGYAFYLLFDAATYLDASGIKKFSAAARLQKEAYRAWLFGLSCNVLAGTYTLWNLRKAELKHKSSGDAEKTMQLKKLQKWVLHMLRWVDFTCTDLLVGNDRPLNSSYCPICAT